MATKKQIIGIAVAGAAVLGWAAFRPELLFVNKTVNEKLPTMGNEKAHEIASGMFSSEAHETKGSATLVKVGNKSYLRLSAFSTSNGPDVRVYLLKEGQQPTSDDVLDLGSIKGNQGDQNYELPTDVTLTGNENVSIWCKRFSVGFGTAKLHSKAKPTASSSSSAFSFIPLDAGFGSDITVTSGKFGGDSGFAGSASIVESNGTRNLKVQFSKIKDGKFTMKLLKKESLKIGAFDAITPSVDLGSPQKGTKNIPISKEIDAWLYRSVAVIKDGQIVSFVNLRSAQEKSVGLNLA
jgi:hypothetical protein